MSQERMFEPPVQPSVRARALIESAETRLASGWVDRDLAAVVAELRGLEAEYGLATLFPGRTRWLDRYDAVLQAYRELP